MSSPSKEELECRKLAQDMRHDRIKLYLSIIGAIVLLLGLVVDRLKTHEQQRYEFGLAQFNQKLIRMNAIAEEYDKLFAQTAGVLDRNRSRTWLLINQIHSLEQELRDTKPKNPEVERLRQYVHDVSSKLAGTERVSVDEWADALALEARWDALSRSPTPDFEHYFVGPELLQSWQQLRESALAALQAEYTLAGREPREKKKWFTDQGSAFQAQLYGRIRDARAHM